MVDLEHNMAMSLIEKLQQVPEYEDCFISGQEALLRADSDSLLVVVDTNRPDQVEALELLESISRITVIDHHRRAADYIQNVVLNLHEPFASSASELVAELLEYSVEPRDILPVESESLLAGIVGLIVRRKNFGATDAADDDIESMMSKEAAYYVNNLIMIVFAVLLAYMTVSSALPSWLPFGGQSLSAGTYNAIARPLGIAYLAVLAICPLLGWRRTDKKAFWRSARVPALCALVLFVVLMIYFATYLLPSYQAMIDMGGTQASGLLEQGNPIDVYKRQEDETLG